MTPAMGSPSIYGPKSRVHENKHNIWFYEDFVWDLIALLNKRIIIIKNNVHKSTPKMNWQFSGENIYFLPRIVNIDNSGEKKMFSPQNCQCLENPKNAIFSTHLSGQKENFLTARMKTLFSPAEIVLSSKKSKKFGEVDFMKKTFLDPYGCHRFIFVM